MAHRWLSNDVNDPDTDASDTCFACGVTIDYPRGSYEDHVQWLVPDCKPGNPDRAHHFVLELVPDSTPVAYSPGGVQISGPVHHDGLVCAYGDATVAPWTDSPSVGPCVGA